MIKRLYLIYRFILLTAALCCFLNASAIRTGRMFSDPAFDSGTYVGFCRNSDGFLWIATESGLLKFDGNNYILYRHDENNPSSLSDSRMLGVMSDSRGRIWAATANGLNLYDEDTDSFRHISLPSMNYGGYIIDITEQDDGTITFIVAGKGLYVVDETHGEPTAVKYLLNCPDENEHECVIQNPNGRLYTGTRSGKVYSISPNGSPTCINVANGYITDIINESDGNILVSSVSDIYRIHTADNRVEPLWSADRIEMNTNNFTRGIDDTVYFSTSSSGMWKIEPGKTAIKPCTTLYLPSIDLSCAKLGAAYADSEGNLWIGCLYKGLACIPYNSIPFNYHLISDAVSDFKGGIDGFAIFDDKVAIGYGNKLAILTTEGKLVSRAAIPTRGIIRSIIPLSDDKLLVGLANDGIWEYTWTSGRLHKMLDQPGKYPTLVMCRLPGEEYLIGFHGVGLLKYNRATGAKKWYEFDPEGGRLNNPFFASMEMSPDSSHVWIGLYGGISCYDIANDELRILDQMPFIKGATYALASHSDGSVLAGTSHGLIYCDAEGNVRRKYTAADGLTDNDVRSVSVDSHGGSWIGTKRGLTYLKPDGDSIVVYYGGYGLFEKTFPYSGVTSDNSMILGSDLGLTIFHPDSIPAMGFDRHIEATAIILNGLRINRSTTIDGNPVMSDDESLQLNLPYKDNSLTLKLSTLDFRDAANVRYIWRISGLSDDWTITAPGENVIYLPHLDPGTYRLFLKATDNNVTSDETVITIVISTPWYMTGAAKALYVVIILVLIILSIVVMEKKRGEKISEAKIRFFIDVSHDIRSPITLILTPLESLLKEPFPPAVNEKLRTMYRNGQRILSLVNQLLDLRKIEKGGMRLLCRPTNLAVFIEELVDMFKPQAADKKISLEFRNDGGVPDEAWVDRDNFDKILVNIISNAIKYTPNGEQIEVILKRVEDDVLGPCAQVSVVDTGIGLGNKTQEQIFARFYRARENHSAGIAGVGIGLDLCRQLTLLHHGSISGCNRTDGVGGSVFSVRIPLAESAYAPTELIRKNAEPGNTPPDKHLIISNINHKDIADKPKRKRVAASRRILFVDDDKELRDYIRRQLEESGYKITTADNGADALKIINEGNIDLVICDVKMPVMDGLTFLRLMKSNVDTHHIPVIMLSSKNEIADRIEGWDKGADGYLGKPFNIEELDTLIDNLIGNRLKLKGKFSGAQNVDASKAAPELKGNDEALMEKIMSIINSQIDNPDLNVEMLGRSVGISRVQLHRKLKDIIGMTPSDFIRNIRLKRACTLLQKPDVDVTQVAYAVGFSSQPHFSTAFKRYTGFSPTEYRQRCLHGDVPPAPENPIERL